jgi:hypothetical protein
MPVVSFFSSRATNRFAGASLAAAMNRMLETFFLKKRLRWNEIFARFLSLPVFEAKHFLP